jgi:hypothetical protein
VIQSKEFPRTSLLPALVPFQKATNVIMLSQLSLLTLAGAALAVPFAPAPAPGQSMRRADISSSAVVGFAQTVPDTVEGTLMLQYQPYLKVVDGCVPFPAVDSAGDTR